jgi:DNA mismatch repair protein MSH6
VTRKQTGAGSVFEWMDHTKTGFGKRMLKKWLASPLYNIDRINERLDAVEDLMKHNEVMVNFQEKVRMLPDLERDCSNIYKMSAKTSATLLTFDRLDMERLRDFFNLMNKLKYINEVLEVFKNCRYLFKSQRLRALVTMQPVGMTEIITVKEDPSHIPTRLK